jgi:3-methyl-2-oxobutanoate hydroxymethyltransferase
MSGTKRITAPAILSRKGKEKIVCLTCYTAPMARLLDKHTDILLVGDSLGMVLYGLSSTHDLSIETMALHAAAVVRGSSRSLVVVDMPFGSYQASKEEAFKSAAYLIRKSGCQAVKLEGGAVMAETIAFLTERGIPVMAHIGLEPQSVHRYGGYIAQGKTAQSQKSLLADSLAVSKAGAFALVLESITEPLARKITEKVAIPTIGIGASPACDGQVLVSDDMLGVFGSDVPRFVKRYAEIDEIVDTAAATFAEEVRSGAFPAKSHCFGIKEKK